MSCGHLTYYQKWCVELSQFKFFHDDWLDCTSLLTESNPGEPDYCYVNLDIDFFKKLNYDINSIKSYASQAAKLTIDMLGSKPALCFSGGVDSQCAILSFIESGYNCDIVFMKFKNDLNAHDLQYARAFCKQNKLKLIEIEFDVLNFLSRENLDYAAKYNCPSPHFTCHYKFFDILQAKGYTGVVCGGTTPLQTENFTWGTNYTRNNQKYMIYAEKNNFPCQGNFLTFYPELSWALSLLTEKCDFDDSSYQSAYRYNTQRDLEKIRYIRKVDGMERAGFKILPQINKFTGFELIKKKLEKDMGDGWAFEKLYRHPLEKLLIKHSMGPTLFRFKEGVDQIIKSIYSYNFIPGIRPPARIRI